MTDVVRKTAFAVGPAFIAGCIAFAVLGTLIFFAAAQWMAGGAIPGRSAPVVLALHIGSAIPALFLGAVMLLLKKGTVWHKRLGRIWAALMMTTATASFWLTSLTGGLSPIHIFSVVTIVSIPRAIYYARIGNFRGHQRAMIGPYVGLVVAGLLAFTPGRTLGALVFGG